MSFYGRHRVYLMIIPWENEAINITTDLIQIGISKSCDSGQTCRFSLFPRLLEKGRNYVGELDRSTITGYMDVLRPNDWVFVWVEDGSDAPPEPLFLGFIDRASVATTLNAAGERERVISVSCSGWEKAIENTIALTHPYISTNINIANLIDLGPASTSTNEPGIGVHPDDVGEDGSSPGVQLFNRRIPDIIEWLLHKFLAAEQSMAPNVDEDVGNAAEDASEVAPDDKFVDSVQSIMGQFELPQSNIPLWGVIKLAFEDMDQRVYVNQTMFLNQTNTSLSNMIDQYANTMMNTIIYDVRRLSSPGLSDINLRGDILGGYDQVNYERVAEIARSVDNLLGQLMQDVAPHIILRKRPLFADEIGELDGPILDESVFSNIDVGPSDADLHNMTIIDTPSVDNRSPARLISGFPGFERWKGETLASIRRHGLRFYQATTAAWPGPAIAAHPTPELVREWDERMHRAGLDNVYNWSGSASIHQYVKGLYIGGKLGIMHTANPAHMSAQPRVYYVDSIDYDYHAEGGFTTSVSLVRGQEVQGLVADSE